MTKNDLAISIAQETKLRQMDVKNVIQLTLDHIIDILATKGRIELRNFGVFQVKERKARMARNPKTGEPVPVPARRVVKFVPGKRMTEKVAASGVSVTGQSVD